MTVMGGIVIVLMVMLIRTGFVAISRCLRFWAARKQSRKFVHQSAAAFQQQDLDEVILLAARNSKSHIAAIAVSALCSAEGMPCHLRHEETIDAAMRSMERSSARSYAEMRRGLGSLATVASVAPFVGLLGTVMGIFGSFTTGHGGIGRLTSRLSEALEMTAMGLLPAVAAAWCYNYLTSRLECFQVEMKNASSELITYLMGRRGWHTRFNPPAGLSMGTSFLDSVAKPKRKQPWEASYDRQALILLPLWFFWLYFVFELVRTARWSFSGN
jgi:biopolymer transport protein ExbB/TolQ